MKMTIATKIAASFMVMVTLIIISVSIGLYGNSRLAGIINYIGGEAWHASDGAVAAIISVQEQLNVVQGLVINPDQASQAAARINALEESIQNSVNRILASKIFSAVEMQALKTQLQRYSVNKNAIFAAVRARNMPQASDAQQQFSGDAGSLIEILQRMRTTGAVNIETRQAVVASAQDIAYKTLVVVLTLSLLLCFLNYWYVDKTITRPVNEAVAAMRGIARGAGDLTVRMDIRSNDEIGALSDAFNGFVVRMRELVVENVAHSSQVAQAISQLGTVTTGAHGKVTRQASEIGKVTEAVNKMASTAGTAAQNAANASHNTNLANQHATRGKQVVEQTARSIKTLAGEVTKAADVVAQLERESQNIGAVLDVIKAIAEQTNLLALNAAIEAARAGEQGRGFAVVADEVRSLASRTQQSTQEIEHMIEGLQARARMATEAMQLGGNQADEAVNQVNQASLALDEINHSVAAILQMNGQIVSAIEAHAMVSSDISKQISMVSGFSTEIQGSVQLVSSAGGNLETLAGQLIAAGGRFKV